MKYRIGDRVKIKHRPSVEGVIRHITERGLLDIAWDAGGDNLIRPYGSPELEIIPRNTYPTEAKNDVLL